jgi:glycosyltransferase involved in cell wall biosynthesis
MNVSVHSSRDLRAWEQDGQRGLQPSLAPYGAEKLSELGFTLLQGTQPRWIPAGPSKKLRELEARNELYVGRTLYAARTTARSSIALAMLEPVGYVYSLLAQSGVRPWSSTPLAALTCWLADEVRQASASRRDVLRRRTRATALFVVWSTNQLQILHEQLGIAEDRLFYVPFGIAMDYYRPSASPAGDGYVLAAGIDRGRDYPTFVQAVGGLDYPVKLVCPRSALDGLQVPRNVELLGLVDKPRYRDLVQHAAAVVVPVRPAVAYPTGQSVLLNAMSCAVPTVVTSTVALADYARHGDNTWTVAGEDPEALRQGIERVLGDTQLAATIARGGRRDVVATFNSNAMWQKVAPRLRALAT